MTLTAQIRRLTGVTVAEVADADVLSALSEHRVWQDQIPVSLQLDIANVAMRGTIDAWGSVEPATQTDDHVTLTTSTGGAVAGTWSLDADGTITFDTDQAASATLYASTYSYDVKAAAVDVLDQLLGALARDYDVKLGDETLHRSQAVKHLEGVRDRLAAGRLAVAVQRGRVDEGASPRVSERLMRRAMRE